MLANRALILHLIRLQILIQIESVILNGYILLLKSGQQVSLRRGINGVIVNILEKEVREGECEK